MAMNRYGRIYHSDLQFNTLRFPSADARQEFAEKFEQYHAKYDHDGEPPRFESIAAAEANKGVVHDVHEASIDGYSSNQIWEYHNNDNGDRWTHYEPPTTIAPPVIVVERLGEFVDSSTLTRHELSAIFMDMPDEDFQNLLKSVERDGFKDPIIRMIDTQVLDGWHRYRAAKELNLLRKLRFRQWNEQDEGDPAAFVYARNQNRRHHSKAIRAQIAITFHKRFGHGGDRTDASGQNDDLKTRQEIADEVGVSTKTIDRATQIEKSGRAGEVISGEKSASEIITELTVQELSKQLSEEMRDWKQRHAGVSYASKSSLIQAYREQTGSDQEGEATAEELKGILELMREDSKTYALRVRYSQSDERKAYETAKDDYLKARQDFSNKVQEKGIPLSAVIEAAQLHYHRTNIEAMFEASVEMNQDDTLTIETFEDWTGFLRVLYVDVKAAAPWMPKADTDSQVVEEEAEEPLPVKSDKKSKPDKADTDTEGVDSEIKAEFYNAFKDLQGAEQLERYTHLPVGRTPLTYAEAIQTYYEFQTPRIQPNTEPTAEHYAGAAKLMQERPVDFIKQLEGRHYRRIVEEWDNDVLPQLVERYTKHYWGQAKMPAEKLETRIRQAIREAYGFKGRITTQLFDVLFEITEDAHCVLIHLGPEDWHRNGNEIVWAKALYAEFKQSANVDDLKAAADQADAEAEKDLEKACESLSEVVGDFISCFVDDEGFALAEYDKLCDVAAVRFKCDRDTLYQLLYDENVPEHFGVAELTGWEAIVRQMLEAVESNAEWVKELRATDCAQENDKDGVNSNYRIEFLNIGLRDADDNPVSPLKFQFIASRQMDEHPLSEVPDALRAELLKLVERIKGETQSIPETLDNEVLCPDDEADRQAMNSDTEM